MSNLDDEAAGATGTVKKEATQAAPNESAEQAASEGQKSEAQDEQQRSEQSAPNQTSNQQGEDPGTIGALGTAGGAQAEGAQENAQQQNDDADQPDPENSVTLQTQGSLISRFNREFAEPLEAKLEDLAQHTYLTGKGQVEAMLEEVERLAKEAGWVIHHTVAVMLAASLVMEHKIENEIAVIEAPKS